MLHVWSIRKHPGVAVARPGDAFAIRRSLPHGHVAAVLGTMRRLGLGREPEARGLFSGAVRCVRRPGGSATCSPGRIDRRGWLRPGLSRWMQRDSPAMIRRTDRARNMAPVPFPTRRRPFRRFARISGRSPSPRRISRAGSPALPRGAASRGRPSPTCPCPRRSRRSAPGWPRAGRWP